MLTTVTYPTEDSTIVQTADGDSNTYAIEPGTYRRILGMTDGEGPQVQTYTAEGRLQSSTDRRNVVTQYEYDSGNATLSAMVEAVGTDDDGRTAQ